MHTSLQVLPLLSEKNIGKDYGSHHEMETCNQLYNYTLRMDSSERNLCLISIPIKNNRRPRYMLGGLEELDVQAYKTWGKVDIDIFFCTVIS